MNNLRKKSIQFLQNRYPQATVLSEDFKLREMPSKDVIKVTHFSIAQDWESGIKQKLIAVPDFGSKNEIQALAIGLPEIFNKLDASTYIARVNINDERTGHDLDTDKLISTPKIIIYTDNLYLPYTDILAIFRQHGLLVEIVHEKALFHSLFISYGDPDEIYVSFINNHLVGEGIQTWFFPTDSLPGQKLHRVMFEGVNNHTRVLLVCSESSLCRSGVLNEVERVLEREAREGGTDILLPITFDDYVFEEWAPQRTDLADQVRSRVITKFPKETEKTHEFCEAASKLVKVLRKTI